jgi:Na+-translocating ferredoxin:NAD+ oxidoreductase subunit B
MEYGPLIAAIVTLGGLGVAFALVIAAANARLAVDRRPLADEIAKTLPGVNCGACGYGGCSAYADAVAEGRIGPSACIPGGGAAAERVARLTGTALAPQPSRAALVHCNRGNASHAIDYRGVKDCKAVTLLADNTYDCRYACIGMGTCARACPFSAIAMSEVGLPVIDEDKCTGCGLCAEACPKDIITTELDTDCVHVLCRSRDAGALAATACDRACTACGKCAKSCPENAIEIRDFLARIDYNRCTSCGKCVVVCPTGAIGDFREMRRRDADAS